jgi:hypothetical protein
MRALEVREGEVLPLDSLLRIHTELRVLSAAVEHTFRHENDSQTRPLTVLDVSWGN